MRTYETADKAKVGTTVHAFEMAGLGRAPFSYRGMSLGKGSCAFCGTYIVEHFWVKSADGKSFKVGSDCIYKSDDAGLRMMVDADKAKAKRDKDAAKVAAVREQMADGSIREALASMPHPKGWEGKTLLDWADWMMEHAGTKGRLDVGRVIKAGEERGGGPCLSTRGLFQSAAR